MMWNARLGRMFITLRAASVICRSASKCRGTTVGKLKVAVVTMMAWLVLGGIIIRKASRTGFVKVDEATTGGFHWPVEVWRMTAVSLLDASFGGDASIATGRKCHQMT